jgi:hypothetical protein
MNRNIAPSRGQLVVTSEGCVYEFGYFGSTGLAICYDIGECNMQDAHAIDPEVLTIILPEFADKIVRQYFRAPTP